MTILDIITPYIHSDIELGDVFTKAIDYARLKSNYGKWEGYFLIILVTSVIFRCSSGLLGV